MSAALTCTDHSNFPPCPLQVNPVPSTAPPTLSRKAACPQSQLQPPTERPCRGRHHGGVPGTQRTRTREEEPGGELREGVSISLFGAKHQEAPHWRFRPASPSSDSSAAPRAASADSATHYRPAGAVPTRPNGRAGCVIPKKCSLFTQLVSTLRSTCSDSRDPQGLATHRQISRSLESLTCETALLKYHLPTK